MDQKKRCKTGNTSGKQKAQEDDKNHKVLRIRHKKYMKKFKIQWRLTGQMGSSVKIEVEIAGKLVTMIIDDTGATKTIVNGAT
ncbi:Hypothetical predicted protein [Paramuricea clavata]|uniref:Uncharacterized protein n=1 Tax=Paramuricea clavata TaxID=317549 RepID=A0A7D9E2Y6_PARCT|nr:Hypothetical predicted protein [Paramuricea clavata]